jgi:hypothetical protein
MTTSESINEIAAALAKAQGAMKNAALNKVNPHFKSKYADLAGIRDTVTPALTANGIAVVQVLGDGLVYTRLLHSSGQWIESACPIPVGQTMQAMGSAITYARRYSLSAICNIAADEDDDANAASTPSTPKAVFDDKGYREWTGNLELSAPAGSFDDLVETVRSGKPEFQDALRADKKLWTKLKGLTQKVAVPA